MSREGFVSCSCSHFMFYSFFPTLTSKLSENLIYLKKKTRRKKHMLFMLVHLFSHFSCSFEGFKGHRTAQRAGWVRGFRFTHRVEDWIFPKKTGAAIWVEVMGISMHAVRIGGGVGGERTLKTKWTKSSWFECSSAHILCQRYSSSNKALRSEGMLF